MASAGWGMGRVLTLAGMTGFESLAAAHSEKIGG